MSALLGLHLGRYILLASDTRQTYYDGQLNIVAVRDDCDKLTASAAGLMAGSGAVSLMERVIARRPEATTARRLLEIIREEQSAFDAAVAPAIRQYHGAQTGWMMTDRTETEDLRFVTYHPSFGHRLAVVPPGGAASFIPEPPGHEVMCEEFGDELTARLDAGLRVCEPDDALDTSIHYHIAFVRALIVEAAGRIPSISPNAVIGVHTASGLIGMTEFP